MVHTLGDKVRILQRRGRRIGRWDPSAGWERHENACMWAFRCVMNEILRIQISEYAAKCTLVQEHARQSGRVSWKNGFRFSYRTPLR